MWEFRPKSGNSGPGQWLFWPDSVVILAQTVVIWPKTEVILAQKWEFWAKQWFLESSVVWFTESPRWWVYRESSVVFCQKVII